MVTITEDYVSFETAKLLKEKGFDVYGDGSFGSEIKIWMEYSPFGKIRDVSSSRPSIKGYPAPTLQMAMKWLREEKNIFIDICTLSPMAYTFRTAMISDTTGYLYEDYACEEGERYMNYDEAVEAALSYVLENILSEE